MSSGLQEHTLLPCNDWSSTSEKEMLLLYECHHESFYRRSLPISTALGTITYLAIHKGHFSANPRLGAIPKVLLAVTGGYFIGRYSYYHDCMNKFKNLPHNTIGF